MRSFGQLLRVCLPPAGAVALLVGAWLGRHGLAAGFPVLALDAVRRALVATVLGGLLFTLFLALLQALFQALSGGLRRRVTERRPAGFWLTALVVGLAAAPFVALWGYHLNRSLAVRPAELLEPWALIPNLALLGTSAVAVSIASAYLRRRLASDGTTAWWPALVTVAVAAVLHLGVLALYRGGEKARPDVLVLLVDALRADHLGAHGYDRATTPAIDRLARDGVLFRQAIAPSTFTKTSIASLMTGRHPYRHGIYWGQRQLDGAWSADVLDPAETTLAEVLAGAGYLTAAWVQNSHLRAVMGFDQGFVKYHDQQGSIERIHRRFLPWLAGPGRRYSWFAYLHYIDLHDPYRPPPPYDTLFAAADGPDVYAGIDLAEWGSYLQAVREGRETLTAAEVEQLRALYDGQLRAVDDQIAHLLDALRASGRYDDTLIVLTADHGDAFLEHGFISHSAAPYDELVRVPLIVKLPGGRHAGRTIAEQVRLVDVLPTLASAVGAAVPPEVDGCDLLTRLDDGRAPDPRCEVAVIEIAEGDGEPTLALRTERFKVIHRGGAGADELYDLAADPAERHDLSAAPPPDAVPLVELAAQLAAARTAARQRLELDAKTLRELKALGYVGD